MKSVTIGQLARAAGVHVETIRYYQQIRLLEVPLRPAGSVRRYEQEALDRLGFIRRAQDAGFTLKEIAELLRLAEKPSCRGARALAAGKLEQVEARIADLENVRAALRSLVRQCDRGGPRSCAIIKSFSSSVTAARPRKGDGGRA